MWIDDSPHTHPIPIPMGISMGIPMPTAAFGIIHCRAAWCCSRPAVCVHKDRAWNRGTTVAEASIVRASDSSNGYHIRQLHRSVPWTSTPRRPANFSVESTALPKLSVTVCALSTSTRQLSELCKQPIQVKHVVIKSIRYRSVLSL